MKTSIVPPTSKTPRVETAPSCWQRAGHLLFACHEAPIKQLADRILREPVLQGWLLTVAGQPAADRHHLLAQVGELLASANPDPALEWVIDSMADECVHEAVVQEIFERGGFDSEGEGARRGDAGRWKLTQVREDFAELGRTLLAEL